MRRFSFVIFGSLFCFGGVFPGAQAALIVNNGCDDVETLEEPLDSHTEARFKRYLDNSGEPRTFESEEQQQRWCALWTANETAKTTRRSTRINIRTRSLDERFYKVEQERESIDFETDLTLEDLPPSRQGRILARVKSDNCDPGGRTESELVEYAICRQLVEERDVARLAAYNSRRLGTRAIRSAPVVISEAVKKRREQRLIDYSRGSAAATTIQSFGKPQNKKTKVFDPSATGSVPLVAARENRIKRFVDKGDCSRLRTADEKQRCEWLIQYNRSRMEERQAGVSKRLRSIGIGEDVLIRRSVNQLYRSSIGTTNGVLRHRQIQGGLRPTPRTIQEIQARFQTPVTIEGDRD